MAATHDDHLDAIVFDIDGHKLLKIAWVYDENDDLDTVCEEVWGEIKKATRAASEDDLQISTAKGAIRLRRCLQKALQGNAAVFSTVDDGQLMLKVEVLGKVAGKGRATGASRARSTGRSMARQASSSSAAAMSSKLLSRVFVMWPKHTQTVLAFKTTSDGNPDLDDMGNPKVDHKNSCYKGQCIKVSEKDLVWEPLRLAVVQVMEDVFGVSAQDAAEKIRKKASQQAKTIEHAHAAADAAKTAAIAEMLRAAEHGSMGAEAADEISEAVEAAVAAAVPATVTKRKDLAAAEAAADAWKESFWELYERRHEQPAPLPEQLLPFAKLADKAAERRAATAQGVTDEEFARALGETAELASQQPAPGSLVARWFPHQALGGAADVPRHSAGAATAGHEKTADTAAGGTAGAEQHRAPSQSGDGSAGSTGATGERQAPGNRAPSAAAQQRQPGCQASMDGSMQCSGGGMPSAPGGVTPGEAQPVGRLSIASVGDGSMAVRGAQEADGQDSPLDAAVENWLRQQQQQEQQQQEQQEQEHLQQQQQQEQEDSQQQQRPQQQAPAMQTVSGAPQQLLRSGNVQLPAQLQQLSQQQRLQGQQQQQHDETQSLDSAVAAGVGSHASSTAHSRRAVHDQHPRSAAAPAAASAAGAGKGSPGGAAWKNLNKLLGAHHVPPELVQEIGLARKGVVGAMQAGDRPTVDQLRRDATKSLLAFLPTAASKVAEKHGKDHDGDKAAAKRLRRKRRAEAAGNKGADSGAGGAAGGSRQQRQKRQPPKRKKQESEESEEEADSDSSSNSSRDEDEAAGNSDDMDDDAAAAAATNGRSRRAGAGRNQRLEEYER